MRWEVRADLFTSSMTILDIVWQACLIARLGSERATQPTERAN